MPTNLKPGDRVRITRLSHDDGPCAHFIGQTGTVTGHVDNTITVNGFRHDPDQPYGFFPEEVEPA